MLDYMEAGQILCGVWCPRRRAAGSSGGLRVFDYYARESVWWPTRCPAEGAVQVAMEELPFTLHSARVLILGFGRVGKLTAHRMGALGAKVTVSAQGRGPGLGGSLRPRDRPAGNPLL
ncbi:MAG: hypothetical protein ACLS43_09855 [Evtepia gabavorous]